jgi:hypothetical protein
MKNKKNILKFTLKDYISANRKGSRDAEREVSTGFLSLKRIHPSKKTYNRKNLKNE